MRAPRVLGIFALGLALLTPAHLARADEDPAPTEEPSPAPSEGLSPDFLLLPAYDLEKAEGPAPRVGDRIELKVSGVRGATGPELSVDLPAGNSPLNDQGWEVLPPTSAPNGEAVTFTLVAVPLKLGTLTLPSLAIVDKASGKAIGRTNPYTVKVDSAIGANDPKPEEPAELRPPAGLPFPWWVLATLGVIAALALAAAGYGIYRMVKNRPAPPRPAAPPEPLLPEHDEALRALDQLEKAKLPVKAHYHRASEILKAYIGRRYDFDALESTTAEMLGRLATQRNDSPELRQLFDRLDLVKFTDIQPPAHEPAEILARARAYVRGTVRRAPSLLPATLAEPAVKGKG